MEKLDEVIAGLEHCRDKDSGCEGCPYYDDTNCENRVVMDAVEMLRYLKAERDFAVRRAKAYGEYVVATLNEKLELRTCYCPICDKHFQVRSNDSMGNCPDCGHHVVLHEVEVEE